MKPEQCFACTAQAQAAQDTSSNPLPGSVTQFGQKQFREGEVFAYLYSLPYVLYPARYTTFHARGVILKQQNPNFLSNIYSFII